MNERPQYRALGTGSHLYKILIPHKAPKSQSVKTNDPFSLKVPTQSPIRKGGGRSVHTRAHSHSINPVNYLAVSNRDFSFPSLVASGPSFSDVTRYREGQKMHTAKMKNCRTTGTGSCLNWEKEKKNQ